MIKTRGGARGVENIENNKTGKQPVSLIKKNSREKTILKSMIGKGNVTTGIVGRYHKTKIRIYVPAV